MENEKNGNKRLVTLIIILMIMVLGLGGYIVYDKLLTSNTKETTTSNNSQNNDTETEKNRVMSESEALTIGNELWEYAFSTYWSGEPTWKSHTGETNEYGGKPIVCDTTIEQVKSKYSSDFKAQSCFSDGSTCTDYTIDTFIPQTACQDAGRGGLQDYKETTLKVKEIQANKIVFIAKSEYCGSSFCHESKDTVKEIEKDFIITKHDDNWLISTFYLPN